MSSSIELDLSTWTSPTSSFEIPINSLFTHQNAHNQQYSTSNTFSYKTIEIKDATSSIIFSQGKTNLLIAIYGPKETKYQAKAKSTSANLEIYTKHCQEISKQQTTAWNSSIKRFLKSVLLLTSYPKCQINVVVNILSSDPSDFITLSSIYNGLVMCLCLSGIDLKALALTKAYLVNDKSVLISIDANNQNRILLVNNNIPLNVDDYDIFVQKASNETKGMYDRMKTLIYKQLKI